MAVYKTCFFYSCIFFFSPPIISPPTLPGITWKLLPWHNLKRLQDMKWNDYGFWGLIPLAFCGKTKKRTAWKGSTVCILFSAPAFRRKTIRCRQIDATEMLMCRLVFSVSPLLKIQYRRLENEPGLVPFLLNSYFCFCNWLLTKPSSHRFTHTHAHIVPEGS